MSTSRLNYRIAILAIAAMPATLLAAPLFESDDTLTITIEAPMRKLLGDRRSEEKYDAVLSYTDASGVEHRVDFVLRTRGKSRLELCKFPPLRLTFDRDDSEAGIFENQHHVKMVNQCEGNSTGKDWLLQEYGIYRAYNAITDYSFRVRRLEVTFQDSESTRWKRVQSAFLIESIGEAAERLQRISIQPPQINLVQYSIVEVTHNQLFQYLIANTDFSVRGGPPDEGCCHNGKVLSVPDKQGGWIILPYDFDMAGIISTDYAAPNNRLPIRRVSTRLYRGFCWQNSMLSQSVELFNEQRTDITNALVPPGLGEGKKSRTLRYIDRFYDTVNDPEEFEKNILDKCRGPEL